MAQDKLNTGKEKKSNYSVTPLECDNIKLSKCILAALIAV